jgi:rhodanese-related sulfurtransferase
MKITAKQLKDEMDRGPVRVIDVRTPAEFGAVHIEGSELMPLGELRPDAVGDEGAVVVCRSGKRAAKAMEELDRAGCGNLRVLEGGVIAWEDAGFPVNLGKAILPLERQVRIGAGMLVLIGTALGAWVNPGFYGLVAFVGAGLLLAGITDWCGMALLLAKAPWNQRAGEGCKGDSCSV